MKIVRLGIERDNDMMYYIKNGDVWATPRKQPGQPKGRPVKVADTNIDLDYSRFLYYLDSDGDVARKERALGGGRRKTKGTGKRSTDGTRGKKKRAGRAGKTADGTPRSSITGHFVTESTAQRHPKTTVVETMRRGRKSPDQLDREIEEVLARSPNGGSGRGNGGNGGRGGGSNGNSRSGNARAVSGALRRRR